MFTGREACDMIGAGGSGKVQPASLDKFRVFVQVNRKKYWSFFCPKKRSGHVLVDAIASFNPLSTSFLGLFLNKKYWWPTVI